jgi:hypothetical protein
MHARAVSSSRQSLKSTLRLFSTSVPKRDEKPIMNRYSRTVTQPKTQGASQVLSVFVGREQTNDSILGYALRNRGYKLG